MNNLIPVMFQCHFYVRSFFSAFGTIPVVRVDNAHSSFSHGAFHLVGRQEKLIKELN